MIHALPPESKVRKLTIDKLIAHSNNNDYYIIASAKIAMFTIKCVQKKLKRNVKSLSKS
jgi:hypothetical protein